MRTLYLLPALHNEMETNRNTKMVFESIVPDEEKQEYLNFAKAYWTRLEPKLREYSPKRIYLDGWAGGSWDGITRNAQRGSMVSKVVLDYIMKDAVLEKTEQAHLLMAQHETAMDMLSDFQHQTKDIVLRMYSLTITRDHFIKRSIEKTLADGESGMLIQGLHHVIPKYMNDIRIEEVYPRKQLIKELKEMRFGRESVTDVENLERFYEEMKKKRLLKELDKMVDSLF